jgi:hypothetical protein
MLGAGCRDWTNGYVRTIYDIAGLETLFSLLIQRHDYLCISSQLYN